MALPELLKNNLRIPLIGAPMFIVSGPELVDAVHSYDGLVFHDVISMRHARKSVEQGVDGVIAVTAGAGGHAGPLSPFALVKEIRQEFDGAIILSGAMTSGADVLAAQAMGADLAYIGTRFIATDEANAVPDYKEMLVDSTAKDIVYSSLFTGVHGSYLRGSIERAGLDPDKLMSADANAMDFSKSDQADAKAWKDIWGAGQGVGNIHEIMSARSLVMRMEDEYRVRASELAL